MFLRGMQCLAARGVGEALRLGHQLVAQAPSAPDAHQLLAMAAADAGDIGLAEAAFRRAWSLAPGAPVLGLNFATWLGQVGRLQEGIQLLSSLPTSTASRLQLARLALQAGDLARAGAAYAEVLGIDVRQGAAWRGLAYVQGQQGDPAAAEHAYREAIALDASDGRAWVGLGIVLRQSGRVEEALACLRRGHALGQTGPEVQDTINGVLLDLGRIPEALAGARAVVAAHADFAPAYESMAQMLWEDGGRFGDGEDPLLAFRRAVQEQPNHRDLQLRFLRTLLSAGRQEEALTWLERLGWRARVDPVLAWYAAEALDLQGAHEQAAQEYAELLPVLGASSPDFLNACARNAFRLQRHDLAKRCANSVLSMDPRNQEAWSHLGTVWRLEGNPREHWLFDYERLVGWVQVELPETDGQPPFLTRLAGLLEGMHLAGREPINQSVRGGSQTHGRLFGRSDPLLQATAAALQTSVRQWLASLPEDATHPFLARRDGDPRYAGSWSVRLRSSGRHANHIHPEGWLSSAFYVSLPPSIASVGTQSQAGWIQFGQPLEDLGLALAPRRILRPAAGWLALFPSYLWHGTLPFEAPQSRLTIAFDMQPGWVGRSSRRAHV